MLATIFGLILLTIPFLLIFCFKNKLMGFFYILGSVIIINLLVALLTQTLHIFLYSVIIAIHSLIAAAVLIVLYRKTNKNSFKLKINWLVIIGFLIIFFELWSVHFLYTGTVKTINDEQYVSQSSYAYPSFSDEWVGVAFSNYSINHNALPIANPFSTDRKNNDFPNIFVGFFSLISEIFLIISIPPVFAYPFLSIASGLIICLLIFLLLRVNEVSPNIALITTLFIPLAVNGSNLPGLWYLLPLTFGLIFFLLSLIGFGLHKHLFSILLSTLACLLYPPLFVFAVPTIIAYLISEPGLNNSYKLKILLFSFVAILLSAVLIISTQIISINYLLNMLTSSVWRLNLDGGIPTFYIWKIIPVIVLPFSIIGLIALFNKKNLVIITPAVLSFCLWIIYHFSQYYFFIDYARVVVFSSFLIIALAGFGLDWLIKKYPAIFTEINVLIGTALIVFIFFVLSFSYTDHSVWRTLTLKISQMGFDDYYVTPAAPANHYLTNDDLRLFKTISKKRFLSLPWKGLVIGATTSNYPLESKNSIVTNKFLSYNEFMASSCDEKIAVAKKAKLSYVYSTEFSCDKFADVGQSAENLHLYKFIK
jgi:hypothetical protein